MLTDTELAFKNMTLSIHERVTDLLSRMTLEEKVSQMMCVWETKSDLLLDANGDFDEEKAKLSFGHGNGLGQVGRPSDSGNGKNAFLNAELTNTIQKFFIENSRLGIPVFFHEECLHGHAAKDATHFPQPIGMASSFNPILIKEVFTAVAKEARARGTHQALTPVLDVARDARWGRVEETYGEDPFLVGKMALAAVDGLQGKDSLKNKKNLVATLKHFCAHGEPESGTNCGPGNVSERILREVFLRPFKMVIQEAQVGSVMASYNEIDSIPSHANKWLLRSILRDEMGFNGFVVSDYHGILELHNRECTFSHGLAKNRTEAASLAIDAGVNIEFPEMECYPHLIDLVKQGVIDEVLIDEMVAPLLRLKFEMGLFEDPYIDPEEAEKIVGCEVHRLLALKAARESIVLLKNESDLAPLQMEKLKSIAVIGPNADRELLGGYSDSPKQFITVLQGIKEKVNDVQVLYAEGCRITEGGSWWDDEVALSDPVHDKALIEEAVQIAKQSDVVILALGGNEQTSREAFYNAHLGDRASLELVGAQLELIKAMVDTGKPIIAFLFNGRPLNLNFLQDNIPVIFECWYLGQETGHAIADVLFGDYNPGGKLPISFPRSVGHIPCFYNHKPSARRGYLFDEISPLYAFGHGLSYTHFEFSNLTLLKEIIKIDEMTQVSIDVKNTGDRDGDAVVQLYIRDLVSSVTRPVKELKGFKRIHLKACETKSVKMDITPDLLAFYDIHMNYCVEPGDFVIMVGSSSRDQDLQELVLKVE